MKTNIPLSSIKPNPKNPRVIKDQAFEKLKKSILDFPKMMALRPTRMGLLLEETKG